MSAPASPIRVAALWRYPVKSMAGEPLEEAEIRADGIAGDRVVHVENGAGRVITSRTRPRLLGHRATLGGDGEPLVDGRPWSSDEVAEDVRRATDATARLVRLDTLDRFDMLPLLVATDGGIAAFGRDARRLRPNIIIAGVEGLGEREWEGRQLRVGPVLIAIHALRDRCVMTTYDPDTQEQDIGVLKDLVRRLDNKMALDATVLETGTIRVGDAAELL